MKIKITIFSLLVLLAVFGFARDSQAASMSVSPSSGTFTVGSTFDVTVFLDTEGDSVNTIQARLTYPPDKLQAVSSSVGTSIIQIYTNPPKFDNANGVIDLQGGIPGGITVENGVVARFTFRVRSVGTAILRFADESRTLLHDGQGTDTLSNTQNGVFEAILPPPAGPIVVSPTHSDQSKWYPTVTASLVWSPENHDPAEIEGYSFVLSNDPVEVPDNISEGRETSVTYRNLPGDTHYFHIKALREGVWGGVSSYVLNIDPDPPAEFPIEISPSRRTTSRQPAISFNTSDALSGFDHYEIKLIPLNPQTDGASGLGQPLFIEAVSPFLPSPLELGSYDVIVRAYDKAGNFFETKERMNIVTGVFRAISGEGVRVGDAFTVPWLWFWIIAIIILAILSYVAWRLNQWHQGVDLRRSQKHLPHKVGKQLDELKKYREKYGKLVVILIVGLGLFFGALPAFAQQNAELSPPLITTISENISNEEIFYVGGVTDTADINVVVFIQNFESGEAFSETVTVDQRGDWFYRHDAFLPAGNYRVWAQSRIASELSPPTPQEQIQVNTTALQFGSSRISLQSLYVIIIILLIIALAILTTYIVHRIHHGRKKHAKLMREIREAEESVRRGFAVLKRDLEAELDLLKKVKMKQHLSIEEKKREQQLRQDMEAIEKNIGKEIWDIERVESN